MATSQTPAAVYKHNPALWEKNRIKIKRIQIGLVFLPVVMVVVVQAINDGPFWLEMSNQVMATRAMMLLIICGVGWFFALGRIAKAKKRYDSFELTVSADGLLRKVEFVPDLYIKFSDIDSLTVVAGKGSAIRRKGDGVMLWIADELENYDQVIGMLNLYAKSTSYPAIPPVWCRPWLTISTILSGFALLIIAHSIAIALAGTTLLAFATFTDIWKVRYSAAVDRAQKRQLWVLPLLAIYVVFRFVSLLHR